LPDLGGEKGFGKQLRECEALPKKKRFLKGRSTNKSNRAPIRTLNKKKNESNRKIDPEGLKTIGAERRGWETRGK